MSLELEQKIIGTAMADPEATQVVEINPKWFGHSNSKAIYQAISDHPAADVMGWFAAAHNEHHFNGTSSEIAAMRNAVVSGSVDYLKMYSRELHKTYLVTKISNTAQKYAQVPSAKTREALSAYTDQMADLRVDRSANQTNEACDRLIYDLHHNEPTGIKTYNRLNFVLGGGLYDGCLLTIGAATGVGKTAYAVNIGLKAIKNDNDVTVDYFTEEMNAKEIVDRLVSAMTGVPNFKLRDPNRRIHSDVVKQGVAKAAKRIKNSHFNIYKSARSIGQIASIIKAHGSSMKPSKYMAIVDYIGLVETAQKRQIPRYLEIAKITRTLKKLTSDLNIPVIELAQLNRRASDKGHGKPELNDLNESGSIEQDSNVVILLYEDKKDNTDRDKNDIIVRANVAKNRSFIKTEILYRFRKPHMLFDEIGGQWEDKVNH